MAELGVNFDSEFSSRNVWVGIALWPVRTLDAKMGDSKVKSKSSNSSKGINFQKRLSRQNLKLLNV